MILKTAYSVFLGILIALFVGFGIQTFYPAPESPNYPETLNLIGKDGPTEEQKAVEKQWQQRQEAWENKIKPYNRNVSIMALGIAVVLVAISLLLAEKKYSFASDGIMFGGIFTLIYGLGRGFAAQDAKYSFIAVGIGLVVVFVIGYLRFFKEHTSTIKAKK